MINEEFWNRELRLFEVPRFQCPICQKGLLITEKESFIEESQKYYDSLGEPECYTGQFVAISRCNNPDCREITTIVGETAIIQSDWEDRIEFDASELDDLDLPHSTYKTIYYVKYTNPPIRLIRFPKGTPKELVKIIDESFQLFWVDEASCGNKIRSAIEKLLDLQKINKTRINKNKKRESLPLHQRIVQFKSKEPEIANYLLALKWIGNQGSHANTDLSKDELVDAYKILEVSLIDLFDKTRLEVNQLAYKINRNKKHKTKRINNSRKKSDFPDVDLPF